MALKSWDSLCLNKAVGGLGFKKFFDINTTILTKLGWLITIKDERLWVQVLESKYMNGKSLFSCVAKKEDSSIWKSIFST